MNIIRAYCSYKIELKSRTAKSIAMAKNSGFAFRTYNGTCSPEFWARQNSRAYTFGEHLKSLKK